MSEQPSQDIIDQLTDLHEHPEGEENVGGTKSSSGGFSFYFYLILGGGVLIGLFLFLRMFR